MTRAVAMAVAAAILALGVAPGCASAAYEPCGGKFAGDPCRLCAPDDGSCVETQQLKVCSPEGACRGDYVCPKDGTINCMPVVPLERKNLCSGAYATWIRNNCPGVKFTQ